MRDMLEARKRGDLAFRDKDFKSAIDCYSQVCTTLPHDFSFYCVFFPEREGRGGFNNNSCHMFSFT